MMELCSFSSTFMGRCSALRRHLFFILFPRGTLAGDGRRRREGSGIPPLGPGPLPLKPGLSSSWLLNLATAPVLVNSLLSNLLPPGCVSLGQAPISHLGGFGPGGQGHPSRWEATDCPGFPGPVGSHASSHPPRHTLCWPGPPPSHRCMCGLHTMPGWQTAGPWRPGL